MGKEKEVLKDAPEFEREVGGIEDQLDKDVTLNKEIVEAAAKKISDEQKETKIEDARNAQYRKNFMIETQQLHMQKRRRQDHASKKFMQTIGDREEDSLGRLLNEGKLTPLAFNQKMDAAIKAKEDAYREADKLFDEYYRKMKSKYQSVWTYGWDNVKW